MPQTLLDIAKLNGSDAVVGLIEEVVKVAPEVSVLPARTVKGTTYKTTLRTGFPSVGFRAANSATPPGKSTFIERQVQCYILSGLITVDKAVAQAYEDGVAAWTAIEATGVAKQAFQTVGRQVFYGVDDTYGGDAKGFPGFIQAYDAVNMVVDAGGSDEGEGSSVWLVATGRQDVQLLFGGGNPLTLSDWREETISNVPSYAADLTGWIGLQIVNPHAVCRIKKLTTEDGCTLSDALIAEAMSKFPVGITPNLIFMSRRSRTQLWQSRTVTLIGGASGRPGSGVGKLAPIPTSAFEIPIVTTDSILETEAIAL